jgi:hypothetical protein
MWNWKNSQKFTSLIIMCRYIWWKQNPSSTCDTHQPTCSITLTLSQWPGKLSLSKIVRFRLHIWITIALHPLIYQPYLPVVWSIIMQLKSYIFHFSKTWTTHFSKLKLIFENGNEYTARETVTTAHNDTHPQRQKRILRRQRSSARSRL